MQPTRPWLVNLLRLIGIVYTLFITFIMLAPTPDLPATDWPYLDKIAHVLIYFGLVFIWLAVFWTTDRYHIFSRRPVLVLSICLFYGIVIEAFQHWFTDTRTFDIIDIIANGIGGFLGFLTFEQIKRRFVF